LYASGVFNGLKNFWFILNEADCGFKMFRFNAQIARNSWLYRRFATKRLDISGARYEFMKRSEVP